MLLKNAIAIPRMFKYNLELSDTSTIRFNNHDFGKLDDDKEQFSSTVVKRKR